MESHRAEGIIKTKKYIYVEQWMLLRHNNSFIHGLPEDNHRDTHTTVPVGKHDKAK
jgi:hypothetical protein